MATSLPFSFSGTIVHGEHVGRTIGFPSANFAESPQEGSLDLGVYLSTAVLDQKEYFGLAYFGPRYIHGQLKNSFEVFFYDFSGSLYEQKITVELIAFIRPPIKISSFEHLKKQLEADKTAGTALIDSMKKDAA